MTDSSTQVAVLERQLALRLRAVSSLAGGATPHGAFAGASKALGVLHALASSPDTASDAMALLHELQVHQVEIEMQAQELQESRAELEAALRRQIELYDHQPVGCFTLDAQRVVLELNQTGAEMLALARDDAFGLALEGFFDAPSAAQFRRAVSRVSAGEGHQACAVRLCPHHGPERAMLASLSADPAGQQVLVSLTTWPQAQAASSAQDGGGVPAP